MSTKIEERTRNYLSYTWGDLNVFLLEHPSAVFMPHTRYGTFKGEDLYIDTLMPRELWAKERDENGNPVMDKNGKPKLFKFMRDVKGRRDLAVFSGEIYLVKVKFQGKVIDYVTTNADHYLDQKTKEVKSNAIRFDKGVWVRVESDTKFSKRSKRSANMDHIILREDLKLKTFLVKHGFIEDYSHKCVATKMNAYTRIMKERLNKDGV